MSASGLDRRIRSILAHLAGGTSGGEAVAALRALERLLPPYATLADVIFTGLHHMRQDMIDPSLVRELRQLGQRLDEAHRKDEQQARRIAHLERALAGAIESMERANTAIDEEMRAIVPRRDDGDETD